MANTLDAATLQKILNSSAYSQMQGGGDAGPFMSTPTAAFNIDGYNYAPAGNGSFDRFLYDPAKGSYADRYAGQQYDAFDTQGNQTGSGNLSQSYGKATMSDYLPFALMAAGMAPALLGAGAAGAGGAAGASGAAPTSFGVVDGSIGAGAGGVGSTIGTGTASVGAGGYGAGANYALTGAGTAGATGAGLTGAGTAGAGLLGTGITAADALKYGLPIAGALAGSQGVKTTQDSTRKTDPRVDPYLFGGPGNPGLLGYAQQQLGRDMSPESIAALDSMKSKGMGLMNQPVAQNGFDRFTKGRY